MKTQQIGISDLKVGRIAYGCWRFAQNTPAEAQSLIEAALAAKMNLIDTADIYGFSEPSKYTSEPNGFGEAECVMGEMLKAAPSLRGQMVLATKGGIIPPWPYDSSYDYLTRALERSLTRLSTDYADLYMIHRPDLSTSFEEAGRALDDLVKSGKTRYVGVSNFTPSQARALQANMHNPLICHQNEFSALQQDPMTDGILDQCQERDMALLAWSPLAGGKLFTGDVHSRRQPVIDLIRALAKSYGVSVTQMALAFVLRHPAHPVTIIGTQKAARIAEAARADAVNLSADHWYKLIESYRGAAMP